MYEAFVLAAGLGTRLRPLTEHRPKPLVPMCGVPLLRYTLALCAAHGLRRVVMNAHWLADQVEAWAGEHDGVSIAVTTELPEILGTGGGLKAVAADLEPRFAILNADVLHNVDLTALLGMVPEGGAAMALRPHPTDSQRYGVVAADDAGVVGKLTSIATADGVGPLQLDTHFTGIHALDRRALEYVPEGFQGIIQTSYANLVPQRLVRGQRYAGPWLDAGDPAAYLETNLAVLRGQVPLALDPFPEAGFAVDVHGRTHGELSARQGLQLRGCAWVGHGVRLAEGVALHDSIVGDGAVVPAGTRLTRCVVWDGCTVPEGHHEDVIVYPGGVLQAGALAG